jgi:alkylation response protein AidB-like acyl-CoA dehydrogenase
MDLSYGERHERFRKEVREFLREHWTFAPGTPPTDAEQRSFRELGIERGYVYRDIPRALGGSEQAPDPLEEDILRAEFFAAGAPRGVSGIGPVMVAPTLLEEGTEEQKQEFIPPSLTGEMLWCQGYSEPGSGSDLASLTSRAELDGDEWVINGHKIWTSGAHHADFMFGLFRTEPEVPRNGGISYLLIPMHQPGIEARPLRQMTGDVDFNEVFFENARTPLRYTVGRRGEGWKISRTTLKHERNLIGDPNRLQNLFTDVVALARRQRIGGEPAIENPGIRQRLAEIEGYILAQRYSGFRQLTATRRGQEPKVMMPMLMNKLYSTETIKKLVRLAYDLLDAEESLADPYVEGGSMARLQRGTDYLGGWTLHYMFSHGTAIAGGAPNIQRNIIGERTLGLPRDLRLGA